MFTQDQRTVALQQMDATIGAFYTAAMAIGNHPFIEFSGVMRAYWNSCQRAHQLGMDFSECNQHAGLQLPMESVEVDYLSEKLDCIFGGRIQVSEPSTAIARAEESLFKDRTPESAALQCATVLAWLTEQHLQTVAEMERRSATPKGTLERQRKVAELAVVHCRELGVRAQGLSGSACPLLAKRLGEPA